MKIWQTVLLVIAFLGTGWFIGNEMDSRISTAIKSHNRTFIACMEDMEAGGEEVRFAIDACTIQTHYGNQ